MSCSNQEQLPTFCSTQSDVYFQKFKVWELGLPLCIIPQVVNFPKLVNWCFANYSVQTKSIVTQTSSETFLTITTNEIINMLRLNSNKSSKKSVIPLSKETLIQNFTSLSSQEQFSFVHTIQKLEDLLQVMNFPLKALLFQSSIQLIMSMYTQIMGFNHDQGIPESFLGFLLSLSEPTLFDFPNS